MASISPDLERVLTHSGWFPGRRIAIDHWSEATSRSGLQMFTAAREFLEEFGGLTLVPEVGEGQAFHAIPFTIDPTDDRCEEAWQVEDLEEHFPLRFFPVGMYGATVLLITDQGHLCLLFDGSLDCCGDSVAEALELLLLARRLPVHWGEQAPFRGWIIQAEVAKALNISASSDPTIVIAPAP